jgi:hypothetical protein
MTWGGHCTYSALTNTVSVNKKENSSLSLLLPALKSQSLDPDLVIMSLLFLNCRVLPSAIPGARRGSPPIE